jgi:hypothetical protein
MSDLAARLAALSPEKRRILERRLQTQGKSLPSDRITPRHESSRLPLSFWNSSSPIDPFTIFPSLPGSLVTWRLQLSNAP